MKIISISFAIFAFSLVAFGQQSSDSPAMVDYKGFDKLVDKAEAHRKDRLVSTEEFFKHFEDGGNVIILDTRSKEAYEARHLAGAVHLNFSDFTADKLKKVIPNKKTKILIYCNNNFINDPMWMARKALPLALNIPTFINLYGYGYKNIYELGTTNDVNDESIKFEGSSVAMVEQIQKAVLRAK